MQLTMKRWLGLLAVLALLPLLLIVESKWRESVFHEGYERGAMQTFWYIHHTQPELRGVVRYPSMAWQDCAWHFVDKNENSGFIEVCEHEAEKSEIQ
jgi:hypothetical protein